MNCVITIAIAFVLTITFTSYNIENVFAETQNITVAARSYEQIPIYLNQGDELKFAIAVNGGSNDDISLTIFFADGNEISGGIIEEHSDSFVAASTGTYAATPSIRCCRFDLPLAKLVLPPPVCHT